MSRRKWQVTLIGNRLLRFLSCPYNRAIPYQKIMKKLFPFSPAVLPDAGSGSVRWVFWALLPFAFCLAVGCSPPAAVNSAPQPAPIAQGSPSEGQGQRLPITAKAMLGKEEIALEVAQTLQQQSLGLMYRQALPQNQGMLFVFESPRYVRFWMKNVSIPLDMIFLREGKIVAIAAEVPPCKNDPCATYGPETPIDQVIELAQGRAAELEVKVGDRVPIEFLATGESEKR